MSKNAIIAIVAVVVIVIAAAAAYAILNGNDKDDDNTVTISVDDSIEVGDYVRLTTTVTSTTGDDSYSSTDTTTYTVTAMDENGNLTVTCEYDGTSTSTLTMTETEFRENYIQMSASDESALTFEGTETLTTSYGDIACNVYTVTSSESTGQGHAKVYMSASSGALLKAIMEISGEEEGISYTYSVVSIAESSLYSAS